MIDEYDFQLNKYNSILRIVHEEGLTKVIPLQKIDAIDIIKKIENEEPVEYDRIFIDKYLDLSSLNLPTKK